MTRDSERSFGLLLDEVSADDEHQTCDGCGQLLAGKTVITGIDSCCGGGCVRSLCEQCIAEAADLIEARKALNKELGK